MEEGRELKASSRKPFTFLRKPGVRSVCQKNIISNFKNQTYFNTKGLGVNIEECK